MDIDIAERLIKYKIEMSEQWLEIYIYIYIYIYMKNVIHDVKVIQKDDKMLKRDVKR